MKADCPRALESCIMKLASRTLGQRSQWGRAQCYWNDCCKGSLLFRFCTKPPCGFQEKSSLICSKDSLQRIFFNARRLNHRQSIVISTPTWFSLTEDLLLDFTDHPHGICRRLNLDPTACLLVSAGQCKKNLRKKNPPFSWQPFSLVSSSFSPRL